MGNGVIRRQSSLSELPELDSSDAVVADAVFGVLLAVGVQDVVEGDLRGEFADAVVEFRPDGPGGAQHVALALFRRTAHRLE